MASRIDRFLNANCRVFLLPPFVKSGILRYSHSRARRRV